MNNSVSSTARFHRLPHAVALVCALVIFPLIWMGGLVTTYDAGMAVPDWPNTYGYNLFLYPVREWFFGPWDLFVEHGHRLLGSLAGVIAIVLVLVAFWRDDRKWFCWLSVAALILVIVQGILGGARVVMDERLLAKIHGCVGPAFFAFMVGLVGVSSKWWFAAPGKTTPRTSTDKMLTLSVATVITSYIQLVVGASLRHISIDADPLVYQLLIIVHVGLAIFITLLAALLVIRSAAAEYAKTGIRWVVYVVAALILTQVCLGISTWVVKYGVPPIFGLAGISESLTIQEKSFLQMNIITGHVAVGSLVLAISTLLSVRSVRLFWPPANNVENSDGPVNKIERITS